MVKEYRDIHIEIDFKYNGDKDDVDFEFDLRRAILKDDFYNIPEGPDVRVGIDYGVEE